MTLAEVIVVSAALVACVGIWSAVRLLASDRAARIQQEGIDRRAALRLKTDEMAYKEQAWYVPVLVELVKNEKFMEFVLNNPQLSGLISRVAVPLIQNPPGK
jgi:hypothetical protein